MDCSFNQIPRYTGNKHEKLFTKLKKIGLDVDRDGYGVYRVHENGSVDLPTEISMEELKKILAVVKRSGYDVDKFILKWSNWNSSLILSSNESYQLG